MSVILFLTRNGTRQPTPPSIKKNSILYIKIVAIMKIAVAVPIFRAPIKTAQRRRNRALTSAHGFDIPDAAETGTRRRIVFCVSGH